jgi:hypothetical protein
MKEFTDLLKKKAEEQAHSPVDSSKMEAKAAAIKNLMEEMKSLMGSDLKDGLKKVTVASDSPEGLKAGLDKAKEIASGNISDEFPMEGSEEEEVGESPELEASEDESAEHGSDEDKKIAELEKQLEELKAKKKA